MKIRRYPFLTPALFALPFLLLAPTARAADAVVHLDLYGNINYAVEKAGDAPVANSFSVPTFDLFMSGELDRLTFSAEAVFDFDAATNDLTVDLDRVQLSYSFRSWLRVTAGRFHNALGYYNTAYPNGATFYELGIDRPAIVDSHEGNALLPTLGTGVRLDGRLPLGTFGFASYDLEASNGRGFIPDEGTVNVDHDNMKAFNLRLRLEPAFLDGLIIGGNAYFDTMPASPGNVPIKLREQIFGGHIAYVEGNYNLILEGYVIRHLGDDGSKFQTLAALAQFGYTFGNVTPYVRVELARFPDATTPDPFYALDDQAEFGNYAAFSGGIKYLVNGALALKLEVEDFHAEDVDIKSVTTQAAFAF